jgi:hypothetical protein
MFKNETNRPRGSTTGARRKGKSLAAGAALILASGSAQAILIDDFNSGTGSAQNLSRTTNGTTSQQMGSNIAIIGPGSTADTPVAGWRDLQLTRSGSGSQPVSVAVGPDLIVNSGFSASSTVIISWDGNDSATTLNQIGLRVTTPTPHGIDVTDAGLSTGVILDLLGIDLNVTAQLTFYSGRNGTTSNATGASTYSATFMGGEAGLFYVPFTDFITLAPFSQGADWTDIGAITLRLTGPNNWDGGINLIETGPQPIPEPTIPMLLGGGLLALMRTRGKKTC